MKAVMTVQHVMKAGVVVGKITPMSVWSVASEVPVPFGLHQNYETITRSWLTWEANEVGSGGKEKEGCCV